MEITCELNGIKYLMFELHVTRYNHKKIDRMCVKHECIQQGVKKIDRGGLFSDGYAIVSVLVPEKNVIAFNKEDLK